LRIGHTVELWQDSVMWLVLKVDEQPALACGC